MKSRNLITGYIVVNAKLHFHIQVATLPQQLSNAAQDNEKGRQRERELGRKAWLKSAQIFSSADVRN